MKDKSKSFKRRLLCLSRYKAARISVWTEIGKNSHFTERNYHKYEKY
ncbi:MAG: hypothetical protein IJC81_02190 [Clostridia bacterium]|nr:hypothetical protein [Clostridia bacterium]